MRREVKSLASLVISSMLISASNFSLLNVYADEPITTPEFNLAEYIDIYEADKESYCKLVGKEDATNDNLIRMEKLIEFCKVLDTDGNGMIDISEYSVEINEQNFPDENLRNLIADTEKALTGEEGIVSPKFLLGGYDFIYSDIPEHTYSDMKGIEYFKGTERFFLDDQDIVEVDVSNIYVLGWLDLLGTPVTKVNASNSGLEMVAGEDIRQNKWYCLYVVDPLSMEELEFFMDNYSFKIIYTTNPDEWEEEVVDKISEAKISLYSYNHLHGDKYALGYLTGGDVFTIPLNGEGTVLTLSDGDYLLKAPAKAEETDEDNDQTQTEEVPDQENKEDDSTNEGTNEEVTEEEETTPSLTPETETIQVPSNPAPKPTEAIKDVGDFVNRCYEVALGREADNEGFTYWKEQLVNNEAFGAQVGYGFIFSEEYTSKTTTNEEFVEDLYSMCFGRESDKEGFSYWLDKLENGETRESVYAGFANSLEFYNLCSDYKVIAGYYVEGLNINAQNDINGFVSRLYTTCLNRLPDQIGQNGWVQKLANNEISGTEIARSFILSRELINSELPNDAFVERVYNALFGREADEEGKEYWVSLLEEGGTYADVLEGFTESEEFYNMCSSYGIEI